MPSRPSIPGAPQEGTTPVPSQPTRQLIRLSSPERQRLSSLHLIPDPEMEAPPKPPRSCSVLARQALEGSFVGWGMPVQSPQGSCWPRVGMGGWYSDSWTGMWGMGREVLRISAHIHFSAQFLWPWRRRKKRVPAPVTRKQRKTCHWTQTQNR